jgi:hypothetical protein
MQVKTMNGPPIKHPFATMSNTAAGNALALIRTVPSRFSSRLVYKTVKRFNRTPQVNNYSYHRSTIWIRFRKAKLQPPADMMKVAINCSIG